MNKLTNTCSVFVNSVFVRYACTAPAVGNLKNGKSACALHLRREKEDYESLRMRQTKRCKHVQQQTIKDSGVLK